MSKYPHSITVSLRGGREVTTVNSLSSIFTWTRRDGGLTVRADDQTVRFSKHTAPRVVKVKRR